MRRPFSLTLPRTLTRKGDLVVIPRSEYEMLITFKKVKEFTPSPAQKRALIRAERNFAKGKSLSYHELSRALGIAH